MEIKKIGLVGGTHGNELTGVYLLRKWMAEPALVQREGLDTRLLMANPRAIRAGKRYMDRDLNRCFSRELLDEPLRNCSEMERALSIDSKLGPKGSSEACDLIVDLHNSTAAMGLTLIVSRLDPFLLFACKRLLAADDQIRVYLMPEEQESSPYLPSISPRDICLEAGPQAHGILCADLFLGVERTVHRILDLAVEWNSESPGEPKPSGHAVYEHWKSLDFPRDREGNPSAMIHPSLQHQDYSCLEPGAPLFLGVDGTVIPYEESEPAWPVFLNEQAYYEKGVAVCLTRKREDLL